MPGVLILARVNEWEAQPLAPGSKKLSFKKSELDDNRIMHGVDQRTIMILKCLQDAITFSHQLIADRYRRKHARWHKCCVPWFFFPVAEHRYLSNRIGDLFFFKKEPDFLAIGTPSMVIPVESYDLIIGRFAKQT
jgi:hypothetical protein